MQVKVAGQTDVKRVYLKCNDDQKMNRNRLNELCVERTTPKCLIINFSNVNIKDQIYHPQRANQKVCLTFKDSEIKARINFFFK